MSMVLTPEVFEDMLENMEHCCCKLDGTPGSLFQLLKVELELLGHLATARDFMKKALRMRESRHDLLQLRQSHREFDKIFAHDCARISRMRLVLEVAQASDINPGDERLSTCLSACESVETVLLDLGLGNILKQEQQHQQEVLRVKRSMGCVSPHVEQPQDLQPEPASFLNAELKQVDSVQLVDGMDVTETVLMSLDFLPQDLEPLQACQTPPLIWNQLYQTEAASEATNTPMLHHRAKLRRPSWAKAQSPRKPEQLRRPSWAVAEPAQTPESTSSRSPRRTFKWPKGFVPPPLEPDPQNEMSPKCGLPSPLPTLLERLRPARSKSVDVPVDVVSRTFSEKSIETTLPAQDTGACAGTAPQRPSGPLSRDSKKNLMATPQSPSHVAPSTGTFSVAAPRKTARRGTWGASSDSSRNEVTITPQSPSHVDQSTGTFSVAAPQRPAGPLSRDSCKNNLMATPQSPSHVAPATGTFSVAAPRKTARRGTWGASSDSCRNQVTITPQPPPGRQATGAHVVAGPPRSSGNAPQVPSRASSTSNLSWPIMMSSPPQAASYMAQHSPWSVQISSYLQQVHTDGFLQATHFAPTPGSRGPCYYQSPMHNMQVVVAQQMPAAMGWSIGLR